MKILINFSAFEHLYYTWVHNTIVSYTSIIIHTRALYSVTMLTISFVIFVRCTGLLYEMIRSAKRPDSKSNWKV